MESVEDEKEEAVMFGSLVDSMDSSVDKGEEYEVRKLGKRKGSGNDLPLVDIGGNRAELVEETVRDPTLEAVRGMATRKEKGYYWLDGLILRTSIGSALETVSAIVLPHSFRRKRKILYIAYDKGGHLSVKKEKNLASRNFVWPTLYKDVTCYVKSCDICQKMDKSNPRKAPTETNESLALDIVGPFPAAKGGFKHILTCIDQATKWPEAVPLRNVTAKTIARELIVLFSRTGIPRELLTDQGSNFVGIDKLQTSPYRRESNGLIESIHKPLGAILRKCASQGRDWAAQLPFTMFALRSTPNRDTLLSPLSFFMVSA